MIIDLCFSSDDEKEKRKTRARSTCARRTLPRTRRRRRSPPGGARGGARTEEPARAAEPFARAAEATRIRQTRALRGPHHLLPEIQRNVYERIPLDASAAATVTFARSSDVRIAIAHCSRHHAEVRVDQNARVSLVNLAKAANSTLLNAQPLAPQATRDVRDGDVFEICGRVSKLEASVAAPSAKRARRR